MYIMSHIYIYIDTSPYDSALVMSLPAAREWNGMGKGLCTFCISQWTAATPSPGCIWMFVRTPAFWWFSICGGIWKSSWAGPSGYEADGWCGHQWGVRCNNPCMLLFELSTISAALCMKLQVSFQSSLECEFLQAGVKFVSWLLEKQEAWRPSSEEAGQVVPSASVPLETTLFLVEAQKEMNWPEVAQPDGYVTSMIGFSKKSTFSKAVYLCAASQLDTSKLDGLNEMFHKLDVDRSLAGRPPRFFYDF